MQRRNGEMRTLMEKRLRGGELRSRAFLKSINTSYRAKQNTLFTNTHHPFHPVVLADFRGTIKSQFLAAAFHLHTLTRARTLTHSSPYIPAASWDQKDEIQTLVHVPLIWATLVQNNQ